MKKSCTPVSDLMLSPFQAFFPTACFLMGSLEREQWLNLEGLYAYWFQAGLGAISGNSHRYVRHPAECVSRIL